MADIYDQHAKHFAHWLGTEMVRGSASGYGYDKATAALADAMRKWPTWTEDGNAFGAEQSAGFNAFRLALAHDGGQRWDSALRAAGFTVLQVV